VVFVSDDDEVIAAQVAGEHPEVKVVLFCCRPTQNVLHVNKQWVSRGGLLAIFARRPAGALPAS
jgi:hypothetical protein